MVGQLYYPKSDCRTLEKKIRMNRETFLKLCDDLRPNLEGQATRMGMPLLVEKKVAVTPRCNR